MRGIEKMEFTPEQQAHIDQLITDSKTAWEKDVLAPITTERDGLLQYKPKELTDAEKAIEAKEAELFQKEIGLELKSNQLEDFADLFSVSTTEELTSSVAKLKTILDARKVSNSFAPNNHKQTTAYDNASAKGDVTGMIGAKLGKLFN